MLVSCGLSCQNSVCPWGDTYDLAWQHGVRQSLSFELRDFLTTATPTITAYQRVHLLTSSSQMHKMPVSVDEIQLRVHFKFL